MSNVTKEKNVMHNTSSIMTKGKQHEKLLIHHLINVKNITHSSSYLVVQPQDYTHLQELLKEYKDIFLKDLPTGLPIERDIEHCICQSLASLHACEQKLLVNY